MYHDDLAMTCMAILLFLGMAFFVIVISFSIIEQVKELNKIKEETGLEFSSVKEYECYQLCGNRYYFDNSGWGSSTCTCGVGS